MGWYRFGRRGRALCGNERMSAVFADPVAETIEVPLVVDLDGTLIRSDLLFESLARMIGQQPWLLLLVPFWFLRGRAYLKSRLAVVGRLDARWLPYRRAVVDWLRSERARGRSLILATAADQRLAKAVADHLGLFDMVLASEAPHINLKGAAKRDALVARFGARGFDYAGDALADLPIWRLARRSVVVAPGARLLAALQASSVAEQSHPNEAAANIAARGGIRIERTMDAPGGGAWLQLRVWVKALRVHQWVKNILVFLPLLAGQSLGDPYLLVRAVLAFLAISFCASGTYLINDLLDLEADRQHPRKHSRPFASGALPILEGFAVAPTLMAMGLAVAALLSPMTCLLVALYVVSTTLYSLWLKRKMLVDVFMLAMLYTLRVLIGGEATGVLSSVWLLAFSIFTFLSLGAAKRGAELLHLERAGRMVTGGRDYYVWDRDAVAMIGLASAFGAALVLALYLQSDGVRLLYTQPSWLWLLVPLLLYWLLRTWMVTLRGAMHDDPIVFAATDRLTWCIAGACGLLLGLAKWASTGLPGVVP